MCFASGELCGCDGLGSVGTWLILRCSSNSTRCVPCSAGRESCLAPILSSRQPISHPIPVPSRLGFSKLSAHFRPISHGSIRVVAAA